MKDYINPNSFFIDPILSAETETEILSIPVNKTCGLYSCSNRILRCSRQIITRPVAELMNISIQTGIYPSKFKYAKIIPIYKNEDETDPSNYRPISLLSNFNQIFEKLMNNRLKSFLEFNNILYKCQYGFREMHSTHYATLDIVNQIQHNMDKKLFSCGIFIDLKKAFDAVDHTILLNKFQYYGIRGIANDWFCSYLSGHTQTTQIDTKISRR